MRDFLARGSRAALVMGLALGAVPALAGASNEEPEVFGVQGGLVHTAAEADQEVGASGTLGLFARVGFSHRWALQFDLNRVRHDDWSIYSSTASVMHAFGSRRRWLVPMVRLGVGWDTADGFYDHTNTAVHAEAAAILELRLDGGFVLGGELSFGARAAGQSVCPLDQPVYWRYDEVSPDGCNGSSVFDSTYRAARITLGVAF